MYLDLVSVVFLSEDRCGHTRDFCANCWTDCNCGSGLFRAFRTEHAQRTQRGGLQSHPFGDCWSEQVTRLMYSAATKALKNYLKKGKKLEELLTQKASNKMSRSCSATRRMTQSGLRKFRMTPFEGVAKACKEDRLEDWTVVCQALSQSIREEEWTAVHEQLNSVCRKIGVTKSWSESG